MKEWTLRASEPVYAPVTATPNRGLRNPLSGVFLTDMSTISALGATFAPVWEVRRPGLGIEPSGRPRIIEPAAHRTHAGPQAKTPAARPVVLRW
jgi:hypothetical protein